MNKSAHIKNLHIIKSAGMSLPDFDLESLIASLPSKEQVGDIMGEVVRSPYGQAGLAALAGYGGGKLMGADNPMAPALAAGSIPLIYNLIRKYQSGQGLGL